MSELELKQRIETSLSKFSSGTLLENGIQLLNTLGYRSARQISLSPNTFAGLVEIHPPLSRMNPMKAMVADWLSVDILFQLTGEDIQTASEDKFIFESISQVDNQIIESYLFLAIRLKGEDYPRSKLAELTREVNNFFAMPVMILFQYGSNLTISIINRRLNKHNDGKDVLEKVTLIKGINCAHPSRAQVEILFDLSMEQLQKKQGFKNFVELHHAWQKTLDISDLNKKFYREVADWYFYAVEHVEFPAGSIADRQTRNATSVIRLITRLIFVWFIKEKGLVPEDLFNQRRLKEILNFNDPQKSTYYKTILQNLFFATLNTEMGSERRFRGKNKSGGRDAHYGISTVYRYEEYFKDPARALSLFASIPFLNGGLFECLDKLEDDGKVLRVDGFSDDSRNQPVVPDSLFFGDELTVDMSGIYGDKSHSKEKIRGLIHIFDSYKFTIEENTPLDEEIALDPELLGKVFENLLAAYNPETGTTARKQTGSFYTPREIVNYMVDESLIAYLETALSLPVEDLSLRDASYASKQSPTDLQSSASDEQIASQSSLAMTTRLHHLLAYNGEPHQFSDTEEQQLITAIDKVKVLDPACGSGAFPMGVLHKLVFILNKLDPGNVHWKERQIAKASEIPDTTVREQVIEDIESSFNENELDYGRKLYLIEHCIYGVDIQPIAVQIAKLRFFISLVVDQNTDRKKPNLGIRPLPNLESKFVAANTLIGIEKPQQAMFQNPEIERKEKQLAEVRDSLYTARTPGTKRKYRELDKNLRSDIAELLKNDGWSNDSAKRLAGWNPFDQNASASFFDAEWMFGVADGFSIVIGNPPYVNAKEMQKSSPEIRAYLKSNYQLLIEKWDLYIAFIEKALNLSNNLSAITMIIPNAFVKENYSKKMRDYLIKNKLIKKVVYFDYDIFEASVKNIVFLITKPCAFLFDQTFYETQNKFFTQPVSIENIFYSNDCSLKRLLASRVTLGDICFVSVGMVLNSDEKTAFGEFVKEDLISDKKDIIHCKRYTEGKWIDKYQISKIKYLEWGTNRVPAKIRRTTFPELYEKEKILTNKLGKLKAVFDESQIYCDQTLRVLIRYIDLHDVQNPSINNSIKKFSKKSRNELEALSSNYKNHFILGLLNSKLYNFLLGLLRTKESFDINPLVLRKLPIPNVSTNDQDKVSTIVDNIINSKRNNPKLDTNKYESEIDHFIYNLFGLTEEEIELVEENLIAKGTLIPNEIIVETKV
jgi:adenine-specific DNA-methyltransferase